MTLAYALDLVIGREEQLLDGLLRSAPDLGPVIGSNPDTGVAEITLAVEAVDLNHALNQATAAAAEALDELQLHVRACAALIEQVSNADA